MEKKSQEQIVLDYLRKCKGKGLTSMYAFWRWRITRLSDRIFRLRNKGYHIITERKPNTFRIGYHGVYKLIKEKEWWE